GPRLRPHPSFETVTHRSVRDVVERQFQLRGSTGTVAGRGAFCLREREWKRGAMGLIAGESSAVAPTDLYEDPVRRQAYVVDPRVPAVFATAGSLQAPIDVRHREGMHLRRVRRSAMHVGDLSSAPGIRELDRPAVTAGLVHRP